MAKQLRGDINNDGKIDVIDMNICLKAVLDNSILDGEELLRADANNDGKVSIMDPRKLLQHITGKELIDEVIE
jgi:hypothetical protein